MDQIKVEKDYYERLAATQNEVSSELGKYIELRDRHFDDPKDYHVQYEYNVLLTKLAANVERYNRLEAKLSIMEKRKARWFVLPLPPIKPLNPRIVQEDGKQFFVADVPNEPLIERVAADLKAIIESYNGPMPSESTTKVQPRP